MLAQLTFQLVDVCIWRNIYCCVLFVCVFLAFFVAFPILFKHLPRKYCVKTVTQPRLPSKFCSALWISVLQPLHLTGALLNCWESVWENQSFSEKISYEECHIPIRNLIPLFLEISREKIKRVCKTGREHSSQILISRVFQIVFLKNNYFKII